MYKKLPEILILVGAPGSGKTTFAKELLTNNKHWARVSRDDFRAMHFAETRATDAVEIMITYAVDAAIKGYIDNKYNVIIDATNCKMASINYFIKKFITLANITFKVLDPPLETLLKRCLEREAATGKHIPEAVIKDHFNKLQHLKTIFNFAPIAYKAPTLVAPVEVATKPAAFLCDLDGTVAIANGRNMFDPTDAEILTDTPIWPAIKVLQALAQQYKIIFVSGRTDTTFNATKQWIEKYIFTSITKDQLLMRNALDYRRDSIVKKEMLHEYILPNYNVIGVFDDRLQVIKECWNAEGIYCFNVNQFLEEF